MSTRVDPRIVGVVAGAAAIVTYLLFIRPRTPRWGATDEEVERTMPGDEVVEHPNFIATNAITIEAPPEEVWPWIVQIGSGRAGFYGYDWLDNAGKPSAREIVPDLQHIEVGELIPFQPNTKMGMWIKDFEWERWMLWWDKKGRSTRVWLLYPQGERHTRLITRLRMRYAWTSATGFYYLLGDSGDTRIMRKVLLGIKERAEQAR